MLGKCRAGGLRKSNAWSRGFIIYWRKKRLSRPTFITWMTFARPERSRTPYGYSPEHSRLTMLSARTLNFLSLLLVAQSLASTSRAQMPYDGNWDVTVETKAGSCEQIARFRLSVSDGNVSGPDDVSGKIGNEGSVRVSLKGAYANGQLAGNAGSGRWNAASAGKACSGRWEAKKE
jgi:hypothetical protein